MRRNDRKRTFWYAQWRLAQACESLHSDQSLRCPHEETSHPLLSKMRPAKILIRLRKSDLNLRFAHMPKGTFSDIAAQISSQYKLRNIFISSLTDLSQP